jgi:hypothetical protein
MTPIFLYRKGEELRTGSIISDIYVRGRFTAVSNVQNLESRQSEIEQDLKDSG